jgi:hypothetical protein
MNRRFFHTASPISEAAPTLLDIRFSEQPIDAWRPAMKDCNGVYRDTGIHSIHAAKPQQFAQFCAK